MWERFEAEHPKLLGALFNVLSQAMARSASLKLSRRPRLADWGEYAAAVYEVTEWQEGKHKGAALFLEDWDAVVGAQNQATLDGSPVAQAIIKFMEDQKESEEFAATSTELHKKLEVVAESLSLIRDKAWPKSARWLWRRINEVLPMLVALGIEARRGEDKTGSWITLRKLPRNDATGGNNEDSHATPNADEHAGSGNGGINGNSYGDALEATSEVVAALEQLFEMRPESRDLRPDQLADDLYVWTDLGFEPPVSVVMEALKDV